MLHDVAKPTHGSDVCGIGYVLLYFVPKPFDVHRQSIVIDKNAVNVPKMLQKLILDSTTPSYSQKSAAAGIPWL